MKKTISLLMTGAMVAALAGCGSANTPEKEVVGKAADNSNEKLSLTIMSRSYAGGGWPDNHASIKFLNEKFNVDLNILWVPVDNYAEKLNVLAASTDLPDSFYIDPDFYVKWAGKNVFMDLKPQLDKYPNLAKVVPNEQMWKTLNPPDKYYGIPLWSESNRDSLVIRKDWLDKLQLKQPVTLDEFYEVAKAFTTQDPDGNGKQDTFGFTFYPQQIIVGGIYGPDYLMAAFGLANGWKEEGGKLIPFQAQTNELKAFASFLRKAYEEGVLDKDVAVNKQTDPESKFYSGRTGISYINTNNMFSSVIPSLKKSDPKAEIVQLSHPTGPVVQQQAAGGMTNTGASKIVINAKIDPKKQERLLKIYDWLGTEEGYDFAKHGIEGVHYKKITADQFEKLPATDTDIPKKFRWLWIKQDPLRQLYKFDDPKEVKTISEWIGNNEKYARINRGAALESPTFAERGKELNTKWLDVLMRVIYGKDPVEAIDKAVADWKANGGDTIIQEMNQAFLAASK